MRGGCCHARDQESQERVFGLCAHPHSPVPKGRSIILSFFFFFGRSTRSMRLDGHDCAIECCFS